MKVSNEKINRKETKKNSKEIEANRIGFIIHTSVLLNSGTHAPFSLLRTARTNFDEIYFWFFVDFSVCCGVPLWNVSVLIIAQIIYTTRSIEKFRWLTLIIVFAFKFIDIQRICPLDVNKLKNHRFNRPTIVEKINHKKSMLSPRTNASFMAKVHRAQDMDQFHQKYNGHFKNSFDERRTGCHKGFRTEI